MLAIALLAGALLASASAAHADSASDYRAAVLADNPVSYWRLDETGGTTASDQQGANPGTIQGAVTLNQPGAMTGEAAMSFDGLYGLIDFGGSTSLQPAQD